MMGRQVSKIAWGTLLASVLLFADNNTDKIEELQKKVNTLSENYREILSGAAGNSLSGFQLAGYSSFDFASEEDGDSSGGVKFAPIFHYQYGNIFQFEGELEIEVDDNGETEIELEYAAGTWFINDYMGLQMGKFMSPLGQFVQNIHPSWINKLPSTPVGFGHDGAAPTSNVGLALRGGLPKLGEMRSNYVIFVSSAPTFGLAADGDVIIDASGTTNFADGGATIGGRFAINPLSQMEIAVSAATGEVSEELISTDIITRDYSVFGVDMAYNFDAVSLKAEYVQQKIGENDLSTLEGGTWRAWYAQASYQFSSTRFEPVIRYSDYHNPETNRNQWALGLNYLFTNNLIAKIAYEINKDEKDSTSEVNNNRILAQFAFGF